MLYKTFGTWGRGRGEWRWHEIILFNFLLIYAQYLWSLNNTVIPCVFLPFSAENYTSYLFLCKTDVHTPTSFWSSYINLLNSNLVSKLASTAAEWIVLSFDINNYTELPPYFPKNGAWKLGHLSYLPVFS